MRETELDKFKKGDNCRQKEKYGENTFGEQH